MIQVARQVFKVKSVDQGILDKGHLTKVLLTKVLLTKVMWYLH